MLTDDEPGEAGSDRIRASYRENLDRLVEVKRQYDRGNRFHINAYISPELPDTA